MYQHQAMGPTILSCIVSHLGNEHLQLTIAQAAD